VHIVVGGDFNVAPSDLDCYDPSVFEGATHVSEPERKALRAIEATGLVDLTRSLHPDEPNFTWWDYRNGSFHRAGVCESICFLVDPGCSRSRQATYVDREARKGEKPSDHVPVVADFAL
jgi:exodeoxyribonuclease-3